MATTTNYAFNKPVVGANEDTWGGLLNDNWDSVDTELKAVTDANTAQAAYLVPSGGIIMWSGAIAAIPSGWYLCDGTNGTPNLQNRFVVAAGDTYGVGDTGGEDSVTLTSSQIPSHTHSFSGTTSSSGNHNHGAGFAYDVSAEAMYGAKSGPSVSRSNNSAVETKSGQVITETAGAHTHTISGTTGATGSGASHENRPPYYALAYIMKA